MVFITCNLHWRCFLCQLAHLRPNVHKHIGVLPNLYCVVVVVCIHVCVYLCVCVCVCTLTTLYGSDVHVMEVTAVCKRCCIGLGFCGVTWKADQLGSNSVVVWSVMLHIAAHTP